MELFVVSNVLLLIMHISSVEAVSRNSDIIGMAVAGCVSFILLSMVVASIVMVFQWKDWFNNWMRFRGRVSMPKAYFRKKEEVRKRLISGSMVSKSHVGVPDLSLYESVPEVKEWTIRGKHSTPYRIYEDKDAMMELGAEDDDDEIFTIETEVIEDEVPHYAYVSNDRTEGTPVKDTDADENTYSTVNNSFKKTHLVAADVAESGDTTTAIPDMVSLEDGNQHKHNSANNVRITSF